MRSTRRFRTIGWSAYIYLCGYSLQSNQTCQATGDAPVADDEYPKIELEDGGEESEGHRPRSDGEEVPQHLGDHGLVGHGQLVIARVT